MRTLAALIVLAPAVAVADDLFSVSVVATDGSGTPDLFVSDSSLLDLVDELVATSGAFSAFNGVSLASELTYAGVDDAIEFTLNGAGDSATVSFSLLDGQTFTFSGADIEDQVTEFLQNDASGLIGETMREISRRSAVAVTDGNPWAMTARSASDVFYEWGLDHDWHAVGDVEQPPETAHAPGDATVYNRNNWRVRVRGSGALLSTTHGDGSGASVAGVVEYHFSDRIGIGVSVPASYVNVEGSDVFHLATHVALPLRLIRPDADNRWLWQLTPFGSAAAAGSADMLAGGLLFGGGVNSLLTWEPRAGLLLAMSNQFSVHESIELTYDSYSYDPSVSQQIVKNGVRVTKTLDRRTRVFGGVAHTFFLEEAAIDDYLTPELGIAFGRFRDWTLSLSYRGEFGDDFEVHGLHAGLYVPF